MADPRDDELTNDPRGHRGAAIDRLVRRAQAALIWEQAWPFLAAALGVVTIFLALSWFGLWDALPPFGRMAGVLVFALVLAGVLSPLARAVAPDRRAALSRVDRASGGAHRPATSLDDRLAPTAEDPLTRALWAAHRQRIEAEGRSLRAGAPAPKLAVRDPYALRFLLGLVAVAGFAYAGADRGDRVLAAFQWSTPEAEAAAARVDAWVAPPGYTGRPPIFLTGRAAPQAAPADAANPAAAATAEPETIRAPKNSTVVVRVSGGEAEIKPEGALASADGDAKPPEGVTERRFKLEGDATLSIGAGERAWRFSAIPDEAPTIKLSGPLQQNARGSTTVTYEVRDDYGVTGAEARFTLKPVAERESRSKARPKAGVSDAETTPAPRPLYDAPKVALGLPRAKAKEGKAETPIDTSEHPFAGARATMTLVARDEAGQEGTSAPVEMRLPARSFTKPLARALVEQRRNLALDANAKPKVLAALRAITRFPEEFTPKAGVYLGLTTAYRRLELAVKDDELREAADYLWEIALRIEDGDLPDAERDLKRAEEALRKALENGASEQEIQKLTQDLRAALEKFMAEMAQQAQQQQQRQGQQPQQGQRDGKEVRPDDLRKMIDKMEQLSKQGAKDAAKQALADLKKMLDNLQNAQRQQADPKAQAQQKQLDKLQEMIREQGKLRDQTFQQYRQNEQSQRNQRNQRNPRQNNEGDQRMKELAQKQKDLRDALDQMMRDQGEQGEEQEAKGEKGGQNPEDNPEAQDGKPRDPGGDQSKGEQQPGQSQDEQPGQNGKNALSSAGKSMGQAQGALGQGQTGEALDQQQKAIESLRKGAQALAEQMKGKGQPGQEGEEGQQGAQNGENGDDDPLGRPTRRRESDGNTTKVPGEIEAQRARRVLDELRRRLGDNERTRDELDYIERLLTP